MTRTVNGYQTGGAAATSFNAVDTYISGISTPRVIAVGNGSTVHIYNGSTWSNINSLGLANYYGVHAKRDSALAYSGGMIIAVGVGGAIMKSTNDGTTWASKVSGSIDTLLGVTNVPGTSTWYVVGAGGTLLKSTDDGETWKAILSGTGTSQVLRAVAVTAAAGMSGRVWIAGGTSTVYYSATGGL